MCVCCHYDSIELSVLVVTAPRMSMFFRLPFIKIRCGTTIISSHCDKCICNMVPVDRVWDRFSPIYAIVLQFMIIQSAGSPFAVHKNVNLVIQPSFRNSDLIFATHVFEVEAFLIFNILHHCTPKTLRILSIFASRFCISRRSSSLLSFQ